MKYTHIAWDFDGTLFDSYPSCIQEFRDLLRSYGYEESYEAVAEKMAITARHAREFFVEKYGLDDSEIRKNYRGFNSFRPEVVKPYPGVEEILRSIKESGRSNLLFTNRGQTAIDYLDYYDLTKYFDGFVTQKDMAVLKPDPCGAYLMRDRFNIAPGKLLMVGDRAVDIDSVKPVGFDGCFYNTNHIEVPESANYVLEADNLKGLLELI